MGVVKQSIDNASLKLFIVRRQRVASEHARYRVNRVPLIYISPRRKDVTNLATSAC